MTGVNRHRSAAGVAASRRNGALSNGPRTAAGKAASAQNSRKHGLFSAGDGDHGELSPATAEFARYIDELTAGRPDLAIAGRQALLAAVQAERASILLEEIREELAVLLAEGMCCAHKSKGVLERASRMSRYQRRFRGQRDRALRVIIKETRVGAPGPRFTRAPDGTFARSFRTT